MTYRVKEVFGSIQGEGHHAGTPCVFVRFAGCNLWTGHDETRARDADRHGAACPRFCDTDFAGGSKMDGPALAAEVARLGGNHVPLVVFTGGEPLLQLDVPLVSLFESMFPRARLAVETNGTVAAKELVDRVWLTCSPKVDVERLALERCDELKVVHGATDPTSYVSRFPFALRFLQAEATTSRRGVSLLDGDALVRAAKWVMAHPDWKLSVQVHKVVGLR